LSYTYAQHPRATVVRLDLIVNWHISIQISLDVSLSLKLLLYWREFLLKICLKMQDVKENLVQWTDWDSNRECLKFDKVGKHSSSTKISTVNQCIILGKSTSSNSL